MFDREFPITVPQVECTYQEITPDQKGIVKSEEARIMALEKDSEHSNSESLTHFSHGQTNKIEIHSTIGWTYATQGGVRV
jgi:hypothetical protein